MATRQYIGARYVPIFDGDWDNTKEYEPLVIVSHLGNSYTSRTFIPAGVDISNTTYWALTGNYNAQVEAYRQEVLDYTSMYNKAVVTPEMFGAVGDGVVDDTQAIQDALNSANIVTFDSKTYLINDSGLSLNSGNSLYLKDDTVIKMKRTGNDSYNLIKIINVSDVLIVGGVIDGSKDTHTTITGEQGHCIKIGGSKRVKILNVKMINAWGDGLITYRYHDVDSENISIENCEIDGCRRNGVTLTSGVNVSIKNCSIHDVSGTDPQYGICINPSTGLECLKNIIIDGINIYNCFHGIEVNLYNNANYFDISLNNCIIDGSGVYIHSGIAAVNGIINVNNITITPKNTGINVKRWGHDCGKIVINNPKLFVTFSGTDVWSTTPIIIANDVDEHVGDFGNVYVINPEIVYVDGSTGSGYDIGLVNFVDNTNYKDIYLIGNTTTSINGYDRFTKIVDNKSIEYNNPAELSFPTSNTKYYNLFTNKSGAGLTKVTLKDTIELYKTNCVEFIVTGNNDGTDGIRVLPDTGVVFPPTYENGMVSRAYGSHMKMKYVQGSWQIVELTGTWSAL